MQKFSTWIFPYHYKLHAKRTRYLNKKAISGLIFTMTLASFLLIPIHVLRQTSPADLSSSLRSIAVSSQHSEIATAASTEQATSNFNKLTPVVRGWIDVHKDSQWAVAIQDLENPTSNLQVNADASFETASLYKLFLTIPMAQKLPFASWQTQHLAGLPQTRTYAECVEAMLANSDNTCAEAIGNYLGWAKASQTVRANGMSGTSLATTQLRTTAKDVKAYLVGLDQGQWFDQPTRTFLLTSLAQQHYRAGIPQGCTHCIVLNKTGQLDGFTHDAAIITNDAHRYVLVILSKGGSFAQIADLSELINSHL